jgi:hypothetical protein
MNVLRRIPPLTYILAGIAVLLGVRLAVVASDVERINVVRLLINLALIGGLLAWAGVLVRKGKNPDGGQPGLRQYAPVCTLLVLAPWVGEFLLGNVPASRLPALLILIPMYGGGALLIREVVRRTGRGWPAMLVLAAAYGVIEAGLADQSMFNHQFEGHDFSSTLVPWAGISAYNALVFVSGHAIWSIGIPIAITELLNPKRRTTPWLGNGGLVTVAVLYAVGLLIVFTSLYETEKFLATPGQRIGTLLVAAALVAVAFMLKKPRGVGVGAKGYIPSPKRLGWMSFLVAVMYFLKPESWAGFVLGLLLLVCAAAAILHWARHREWTVHHQFALVAGGLPVYGLAGFVLTGMFRPGDAIAWVGNVVFLGVMVWLLRLTARRIRQTG